MSRKGLIRIGRQTTRNAAGRDVFLLTHWLATVGGSLRSEGYSYEEARRAIEFYVCNVNRLIDIPPRRLSLIAKVIRNAANPTERDEALERMLRSSDQRPRLILPEPWVRVMLWPQDPPTRREQVEPIVQTPTPEPDPDPPTPDPDPPTPDPDPPTPDPDPPTPDPEPDPPTPDPDPPTPDPEPDRPTPDPEPDRPTPDPVVQPPRDPRDAILDAALPLDAEERKRAFWDAVRRIEDMGAGLTVWEPANFIRNAAPGIANRIFAYMTARAIINAAMEEITRRRSIPPVSPETPDDGADNDGEEPARAEDVLPVKIAEVQLTATVAEIERIWELPKVSYLRDDNRWTRAATFQLLGEIKDNDTEQVDNAMAQLEHRDAKFWRVITNNAAMTLQDVTRRGCEGF